MLLLQEEQSLPSTYFPHNLKALVEKYDVKVGFKDTLSRLTSCLSVKSECTIHYRNPIGDCAADAVYEIRVTYVVDQTEKCLNEGALKHERSVQKQLVIITLVQIPVRVQWLLPVAQ